MSALLIRAFAVRRLARTLTSAAHHSTIEGDHGAILTTAKGAEATEWLALSQQLQRDFSRRAYAPDSDHTTNSDHMLQARAVARRYDISARTLDRWLAKSHLGFPKPAMVMRDTTGRVASRLWRVADLVDFERRQSATPDA